MGKPKKGRKNKNDDGFPDDDDVNIMVQNAAIEEIEKPAKPAGKRGKKGKKKNDDDDWDDVAAEVKAMSIADGQNDSNEDDVDIIENLPKKKDKKKNKKKKQVDSDDEEEEDVAPVKGGFAMLSLDDDEDDDDDKQDSADQDVVDDWDAGDDDNDGDGDDKGTPPPQEAVDTKTKAKNKKADKKLKKKQASQDDDIDALLAEIEDKKPGKGKKKNREENAEEDDEATAILDAMEAAGRDDDDEGDTVAQKGPMSQEDVLKMLEAQYDDEEKKKKKKKKKGKAASEANNVGADEVQEEGGDAGPDEEVGGGVKTAAQKKKEKKERQKLQKQQEKEKAKKKKVDAKDVATVDDSTEPGKEKEDSKPEVPDADAGASDEEADGESKGKKKKDKKKKKKGEVEEPKKKGPGKAALKAMQEALAKQKEDEERAEREFREKERLREERIKALEEKERLAKEKKELEKQRRKEKMDQLKKEGKFLTAKQREAQRKNQMMLEALKARGIDVPSVQAEAGAGRGRKRIVYEDKKKKKQQQKQKESSPTEEDASSSSPAPTPTPTDENRSLADTVDMEQNSAADAPDDWDKEDVVDDWEKEAEPKTQPELKRDIDEKPAESADAKKAKVEEESEDEESEEEESDDEEDEEDSETESEEETSSEEDEKLTPAEKVERIKLKARERLRKRKEAAEAKRSVDKLRSPVVCVLGHVDTGKTKILDKLRRTNVQDGEAGGITQQIGATNVPAQCIRDQTKMVKEFAKKELKVPGLLIIDTPGHESFSNLRNRGSSLCDIAILVVDLMHGLEPQTRESLALLRKRKTPFIVALNKIDRLFGWQSNPHNDIQNTIKKQKPNTKMEFDERLQSVIVQFAEEGLNAALSYENKNPREYISLIPTSAHSGDGMGNLMAMVCEMSQTNLAKRISYCEELQASVMEVKAIPGLGTTIDVILVNGKLQEGNTIVIAGTEGPIVTSIRGLLMPQPLRELRVKSAYTHEKEVCAAQGVKIIAKELDHALAGLPLHVANGQDEIEVFREDLSAELTAILESIKTQDRGVYVQASTLGSMEALLEFLRTSKIPYAGINIGPLHKRDVMKASVMLEHDSQWAVILAFDVKVDRDAQELADNLGVTIFSADIIYHLFDRFIEHRAKLKKQKQEEFRHIAVFPCKMHILPQYIFNSRGPIVVGVIIEEGFIKHGTQLCVPGREFLDIGRVTSIEVNHKEIDIARKGQEVCIKIEGLPGDAPKMIGRHFEVTDQIVSKISRQSIDAVKDYFREEMTKADWQLMVELKKLFNVL